MANKNLLEFAKTKKERKVIQAILEYPNYKKVSKVLGLSTNAIASTVARVNRRAQKVWATPEYNTDKPIMEGQIIAGVSTCTDAEGNIKQQWIKTAKEKEEIAKALKLAAKAIIEPVRGLAPSVPAPTSRLNKELLAVYPIAEPHMGMYAWGEESGNDYDVDIAETLLVNSMRELVDSAPNTEDCLIANLADYFHTDTAENKTRQSGNVLDVDTRWGKIFQVGVRAKREVINLALKKHKRVVVRSGRGNHDDESIFCLMMMMKAYFENEPRVTIELPINPFSYHVYGRNLIGLHHGNIKSDKLPLVMATDKPEEWGASLYRLFLTGHIHHKTVKEHPGCTVESFRSIAAKDSWHNGAGYRARRSMECIILDADGGEYGRNVVNIK